MNDAKNLLRSNIDSFIETAQSLCALAEPLGRAADLVTRCLLDGNKLLTCGNGGSAADATHLATEFVVRYQAERRPYPAICLSDSGSTLTAAGNDYDFNQIFVRQVRALGRSGDVLVAFSTSGQSPNIIAALKAAKEMN